MIYKLLIFLLISIQFINAQNQNAEQSQQIEVEGWKAYFDGNINDANLKFTKAIELDSTNIMAKIGWINSKNENDVIESEYGLFNSIPTDGDYQDIMFTLMMSNLVDKELSDSIKAIRNRYDEGYIKFKASLTDSEFKVYDEDGSVSRTGSFKNRKPYGTWKVFGYQNKLHHSYTFPKTGDTVIVNYYKADGDVIKKEWIIGTPFAQESKRIKEVIFWQHNPGKEPEYLFVSKEGFKIYDRENPVVFDETTPDNIIQRRWNSDKKAMEAVIWKNGKQEPYEFCEMDGMVISEIIDRERKTYLWENCKKILMED